MTHERSLSTVSETCPVAASKGPATAGLVLDRFPCNELRKCLTSVRVNAVLSLGIVMSRFGSPSCRSLDASGKPFRPGGPLGHPGRWIRSCCCRRAPGSLSSTSSFAMRSCTSRSGVKRQARTAQVVRPGRKHSTAVTSGTSAICRSLAARRSSICGSAGFVAITRNARARRSSSKHQYWRSVTPTELADCGRCSKISASASEAVQGVGTASAWPCPPAAAPCCAWSAHFQSGQFERQRCWGWTNLRFARADATARFWWMPMLIALLICWRIRRRMRLSRGSAAIRVPKSSAVTGMASTPVLPGWCARRTPGGRSVAPGAQPGRCVGTLRGADACVRKGIESGRVVGRHLARDTNAPINAASLSRRLKERTERRHAEIHELLTQGLTILRYRDGSGCTAKPSIASPPLRLLPTCSAEVVGQLRSTHTSSIWQSGGAKVSTSPRFYSMRSASRAIVAASAGSGARWKAGGRPSHHRLTRCCLVREPSPGYCCADHLTWMRRTRFF